MQERIRLLNSEVSDNFKDTFTSNNTDSGLQYGDRVYHDCQVVDAFTRAGYTLESNDEDEDGWAPLDQVSQPSTLSVDLN